MKQPYDAFETLGLVTLIVLMVGFAILAMWVAL